MAGDGETVIPSLPEPGVWTGMASANVVTALIFFGPTALLLHK
jgi:hypothetical protein